MRILEAQFAAFWVEFLFSPCLIYADVVARSPSKKLQFRPLPKGKPYALEEQADVWGLRGLPDIASGIALAVKNDPPYEIIGNALSKSFEKGGKYPSVSEVIDYELPLIVLASFSLLAAIIIPVTGFIFCCCRVKGKCGGSLDDHKLILHPRKQRIAYSAGIILCALFLILAGSFVLASSTRMNNSIQQTRTVWQKSFDDINIYAHNTLKELNHIAVQEAAPTLAVLLQDVIDLGIAVAVPVIEEGSAVVKPLYESVIELDKALSSSLELMVEIQRSTSSLVSAGGNLQDALSAARQNITSARRSCTSDGAGSACNVIPAEEGLTTEANFTKVPNVTDTYKKVEDVRKTNLTHEAIKGNKSFHSIPNKVQNLTSNFTDDFKNFSSKIDNIQVDVLKPLEDDLTKYLQEVLYPVRDEVDNKYLGTNGALTKYDKYRHVIFILLGVLILLDGVLLMLAAVLGQVGASLYDTPAYRSNVADWGGRLMIGAAGLFFFSAFFVNLLVGVLFLLGANVAVVCDDVSDYKLLQKTIDDPNVMGEYVLAKVLFGDGNIKLTTSGVLSECEKNQAPWNALMMDHLYNLSDVLHYKNKIPGVNKAFVEMNETVQDTSVMSDEAKSSVNESLDAGVQEINYTQFHEQVNKPMVKVQLPPFVTTVKKAVNVTRNVSQSSSQKLKETADSLQQIQNTIVDPAQAKAALLGRLVNEITLQGKAIEDSWKKIQESLAETERFLKTRALSIATESLMMNWHTLFADVDFFLAYVINQVHFDVGRCRPLSNIYRGLTSSVCHHYAAGMNASWVAFGLAALFLLISIILCVRASKHFRRTRCAGQLSGEAVQAEAFELPWMDENTTQHDHQFLVNDFT